MLKCPYLVLISGIKFNAKIYASFILVEYEKAKYKRLENWAEVSKKLYQKGLQKQYLTVSTCSQCDIHTTDLYRCIDCINYQATCLPCLEKRHEFPHLHIFEKWMVGICLLQSLAQRLFLFCNKVLNLHKSLPQAM